MIAIDFLKVGKGVKFLRQGVFLQAYTGVPLASYPTSGVYISMISQSVSRNSVK